MYFLNTNQWIDDGRQSRAIFTYEDKEVQVGFDLAEGLNILCDSEANIS